MSTLKLLGHPYSPATKKVKLALLEKGIPFEETEINLPKRENKTPEFMKLQPFGVVPVLDDNGYILYESRAIVRYLEKKYQGKGTELLPTDLKAYGIAEQGAYLESQAFDPPSSALLGQLVFRKYGNPNHVPDEEIVNQHRTKLIGVLKTYDQILAKQKFIGGETFTIADIFHLPYLTLFTKIGESENLWKGLANVERWYKEITERESVKSCNT